MRFTILIITLQCNLSALTPVELISNTTLKIQLYFTYISCTGDNRFIPLLRSSHSYNNETRSARGIIFIILLQAVA